MHHRIAQCLIDQIAVTQSPLGLLIEGMNHQEVCQTIFTSYRGGDGRPSKGLRLSDIGLPLMKTFFKSYEIKMIGGYRIRTPHLIYMDRVTVMPYWMDAKVCILFDSELAMMLTVHDGNIQGLIDCRYRLTNDDETLNSDL